MRKVFLFIGFFTLVVVAKAQPYPSQNLKFQVDQIRGCAPFTINITATNLDGIHACTGGASGTPCSMIFDGSSSCPAPGGCLNTFTFTSNTPGKYKLQVIYQGGGPDAIDYIDITVDPNIQPAFDIYSCAGSKVEINITDRTYDTYDINFNGDAVIDKTISSGAIQTATFSYGAPGAHNITVQGQKTNAAKNCYLNSKPFNAITTLPIPSINSLTATAIDTLQLAFTPATNIDYKSEIATNSGSNFQGYPIAYGVNSLIIPNVNVDNNFYCMRLSSFDPCANINKYSPSVCSHNFDAAFVSGEDQLTWQTSSLGVSNIQIKRDNIVLGAVGAAVTNYNDKAITCKTPYCYQLVSNYPSGAISVSLQKCGTAINSTIPTRIDNISAVVNDLEVDLVWLQDPAFTATSYQILRGTKAGFYFPNGTSTSADYIDKSYNDTGYCYQVNYTDNCDNGSANGLPACPIVLGATLDELNNVTLNWSGYEGWSQGVKSYHVLRYYEPGQTPQSFNPSEPPLKHSDPYNSAHQVIYYKVTATPIQGGVSPSTSNEIKVVRSINLYHPTAFNPESKVSSLDKTFEVKGFFVKSMKLQIFDRWGALVFYSDANEPWDGKREGLPMPDATYVWTADGTDQAGNSFKRAGTVVLIRK